MKCKQRALESLNDIAVAGALFGLEICRLLIKGVKLWALPGETRVLQVFLFQPSSLN